MEEDYRLDYPSGGEFQKTFQYFSSFGRQDKESMKLQLF